MEILGRRRPRQEVQVTGSGRHSSRKTLKQAGHAARPFRHRQRRDDAEESLEAGHQTPETQRAGGRDATVDKNGFWNKSGAN